MKLSGLNTALGEKQFKTLLLVGYLGLWGLLLPYYRFRLYADTCSYLDLARHYLDGDVYHAINGYWAPLISWLLIPFLKVGADPLLSFRILTMLSGIGAFAGADRLMQVCRVLPLVRRFILAALVPLLVWFALQVNTPDLLSAAFLLFYLAEVQRLIAAPYALTRKAGVPPDDDQSLPEISFPPGEGAQKMPWGGDRQGLKQSLLVGALAAGAYLSKNYNFFFVLVHLPGLFLLNFKHQAFQHKRQHLLKRLGLAWLVFILISCCWIVPISQKYGRLTPGTAGKFNVNLVGPESKGFPYLYQGLIPPPHAQASHSWEDPSLYRLPSWQPWASGADLTFELALTIQNAGKYLAMLWYYHPLFIVFGLLAIWFFFQPKNEEKQALGFTLFAFLLYPLGYWLIYLEERHIWISIILFFILTAQVLTALLRQAAPWKQLLLLGVVFFTLANQPVRDLYDHRFVNQRQFHAQGQALSTRLPLSGKNVATQDGSWHQGLFLSFFTHSRFYGQVPAAISDKNLYRILKKHRIDYFLVWGEPKNNPDRLAKAAYLPEHQLTVYQVK